MKLSGLAVDWAEKIAERFEDPESHPAGYDRPQYPVSDYVTTSQEHDLYVYHVPDTHLGQGASFGNAAAWAETKGNGDLLNLHSIRAGTRLLGGMSVTYLVPFTDLSMTGRPAAARGHGGLHELTRVMPVAAGTVHLHPAFEQREFVVGDGLKILKTFFLPRTGADDPPVACTILSMTNDTDHPLKVTIVANLDPRGTTDRDLHAWHRTRHRLLLVCNDHRPEWVRFFGADPAPDHYWVTADEEEAYIPNRPLPDRISDSGEFLAALQFDLLFLPRQSRKVRLLAGFSLDGPRAAEDTFQLARNQKDALARTIEHYHRKLDTSTFTMPSDILTQGVQWSKANMIRPLANYPVGHAFTNDPGRSSNLVGRDIAWFVHGYDYIDADQSCHLLEILIRGQREDGLIPEFIDGTTGKAEYLDFNINDNTPLFIIAAAHHLGVTGHAHCQTTLYAAAQKAAELILRQRDEHGLVRCTARGLGAKGICGWRNVLAHEQITGVVTELNAECHAALNAAADMAEWCGQTNDARRFRTEAHSLRDAANRRLVNPRNNLYVRNIDLDGRVFTQATVDMVFPLMFGLADADREQAAISRLFAPDFMTSGGIRALPDGNPRWDPSGDSGCMGGIWPGATWWFAMGCADVHPRIMADSLERSYRYYLRDPLTYNTVPGQFNEWSDGQTLVNRGMRLSPWAPPRFLWAALEGVAGLHFTPTRVEAKPRLPSHWSWIKIDNLPCHGGKLSFFITRENRDLHLYSCRKIETPLTTHFYNEELTDGVQVLTTGISARAFRTPEEVVFFFGNNRDRMQTGPFLAHHALKGFGHYHVFRLNSMENDWHDLGRLPAADLQRISVRIEPEGYTLYRFRSVSSSR